MARIHAPRAIKDVKKSYANAAEQQLWRHFFYTPIETLKGGGKIAPALLLDFFNEAINFYGEMLTKYEKEHGCEIDKLLYWPETGLPPVDLRYCMVDDGRQTGSVDIVSRSIQIHFLALGDLYRYRGKMLRNEHDMNAAKR